ncbi:MAG: DUF4397 domain-containing protein [Chitinophagaceae bacterium]|nr:DUF4397 domain-containing protein [Chitinophagaceae bacterium]
MRVIVVICFLLLPGCNKDKVRSTRVNLRVINASPNSSAISFLQNLNTLGSFNYVTGINPSLPFLVIDSGFNNYKLRTGSNEIASWLFSNTGYNASFFICDSAVSARVKYFFLKDNLDTTGLGRQSKIRLVQLSPDLDSVELVTTRPSNPASDSPLVSRSYFGKFTQAGVLGASDFQNFYGDTTVTIKIRRRINSSIARTYQFRFGKGKIYTMVVKGYDARSGKDSLSLSIITHN